MVDKTVDGKTVVQGLFPIMSSILGLPLEILLEILKKNNMVIDWIDFYNGSVQNGWKYKTLRVRVSSGVLEIYGREYRDEILKRLDLYHDYKGP